MTQRIHKITLAVALLFCVVPAVARAGRYHVYSCRMPSGAAAPVDGWSGTKTGTFTYTRNTCCEPGGSLLAALGDQAIRTANTDVATWEFAAPPGAKLAAATLWRAGDCRRRERHQCVVPVLEAGTWRTRSFRRNASNGLGCSHEGVVGEPFESVNRLAIPAARLGTRIFVRASCGGAAEYECPAGQGDPNNYAAAVYLYAADLTLEQVEGPNASNVGGELASAPDDRRHNRPHVHGDRPRRRRLRGRVHRRRPGRCRRTVLDEAGGHCRDVGQTTDGLPAFLYLQPCPSSVSADVGPRHLERLANGTHHLVVRVLDAAGNSAPVLDRTVTVSNPGTVQRGPGPGGATAGPEGTGPGRGRIVSSRSGRGRVPNGNAASTNAVLWARWRRTAHLTLTSTFSRRESIVGRLTGPEARRSAGPRLDLVGTPAFAGAASVGMKGARTRADGTFAIELPAHLSSRALRLVYRAHTNDARPSGDTDPAPGRQGAAQRCRSLRGRPAGAGRSASEAGSLAGPIPHGGKSLVLEARSGRGAWIQFRVVRSDRARPLPRALPVPLRRARSLPVPRRLRRRSRLPVRHRRIAAISRDRALTGIRGRGAKG